MNSTMLPVRVVIIEDQPILRRDIRQLVEQMHGFVVVGVCGSMMDAKVVLQTTEPHVVLLDVSLPDGNSFDLLHQLAPYPFKVIILTAFEEHAIQAIKFGALDYLVKPVDAGELHAALRKIADVLTVKSRVTLESDQRDDPAKRWITIKTLESIERIHIDLLVYCRGDKGYTTFYLMDGRTVLSSRHLKEYEDMLPSPPQFIRPHQSYLVNQAYIKRYLKDGYIVLKDETRIPVSARKKEYVVTQITTAY